MSTQGANVRKTILICSNAYPPAFIGGAELIAHYQAKALQRRGHTVVVFTGDIEESGGRHELRSGMYDGLPVYRTRLTHTDYRADFVNFFHPDVDEQFAGVAEHWRPDVVHLHNLTGLSTGLIRIAKQSRAKVVLTVHDHWGFCFKNTLIRRHSEVCTTFTACHTCSPGIDDGDNRHIPIRLRNDYIAFRFRDVDAIVSPSLYLAAQYAKAGYPVGRLWNVWNGIDADRFSTVRKTADPRVRFTYIGYVGVHKGVQTIIEAIPRINRPPTSFHLTIVGVGELTSSLQARLTELGVSKSVTFAGRVPNERIGEIFANTDVQLLPSVWPENQPVSITEAMMTRTPVIAARIGGISELVDDGTSGYLFEPGNMDDLAAKMRLFIDDRSLVSRLGEAGYARIAGCSFNSQVQKLEAIYDRPTIFGASHSTVLVACSGRSFRADVQSIIDVFPQLQNGRRWLFVLDEWLDPEELATVDAVIAVDDQPQAQTLAAAERRGVPVLRYHSATQMIRDLNGLSMSYPRNPQAGRNGTANIEQR